MATYTTPRRKRRRRRNRVVRVWLTVFCLLAVGYIAYVATTNWDLLMSGLFTHRDAAPAFAEAAEGNVSDAQNAEQGGIQDEDRNTAATSGVDNNTDGNVNNGADNFSNDNANNIANNIANGNANNFANNNAINADSSYATYDFYIPANQTAYESFHAAHPSYDAETVTWMVNAGLDRPFYTDAAVTTDPNPLLVNPFHRLPEDFVPLSLAVIDDAGRQATPETIDAFRLMRTGAIRDGFDIAVQSAYRTISYQQGLYDRAGGDGSVARPAYSEHHTGRALDLWGPDGLLDQVTPTDTGRWVAEHAYEYGFIVRYTAENQEVTGYIPEPWHITYVGETIARAMHDEKIGSLEEYVARYPEAKLP